MYDRSSINTVIDDPSQPLLPKDEESKFFTTQARKALLLVFLFLLGLAVALVPSMILLARKERCSKATPTPPSSPAWNESDYQSNSEYYEALPRVHDFTPLDNLRFDRLSNAQFHPDHGKSMIYLRQQVHMPDSLRSTITLHWMNFLTNQTIQLTRPIWGIYDQQFFWVNNKTILFLSNRASSGLTQLFQLNLPDEISTVNDFIDPIQISNYSLNIDNLLVNRPATRLAFSCQVFANLSIEQTANQMNNRSFYSFDKLYIRHWNEFLLGRRNHPFLVSIEANEKGIFNFTSEPVDLLFGIDSDSPTRPFGSAETQWSFSASGNKFAFTRQYDETSSVAWSTNSDIYRVDLNVSTGFKIECLTCENLATDTNPLFSPVDENSLVYRSQSVPGYESDRFRLKWYKAGSGEKIPLLDKWDRSIQSVKWSNDGQTLFLGLGEDARFVIYQLTDFLSPKAKPVPLLRKGSSRISDVHPSDNNSFLFTYESFIEPVNLFLFTSTNSSRSLTNHNFNWLSKVRRSEKIETFSFRGAQNEIVSGWHLEPINGRNRNSPLLFYIHGGPHRSVYDSWRSEANFQAFTARNYAVIAINFHGSDSFEQKFTNSIIGNYGTLPFDDLKIGLSESLRRYDYLDRNRIVALGEGFGGYMINWIAGQPEFSRRFRTLISDSGIFDLRSFAYSTDELFFAEFDAGNFTPFVNPRAFERFNPVNRVASWSQPMLIIHSARDYRVPDVQGISAFTALQRRGIPSRLIYFPTESHTISNSLNSIRWYDEVFSWIDRWTQSMRTIVSI